ncbi:phosphoenolpyruvate--protein phosphotransferase [Alginatibacterium sediminis]|uniref:Phosphoenolpyruvate--protein phosphotransferase n=1 Tax=Alginatibacterium sediminis TaxID=2164068 RepID=A0A420E626_9ALTE|nr:phosphoenolpyruvate--protein phosphotransferase [Alginatibacterium sediminis]RKF13160.1 phosphoenolpyruvate--protein phosphotransferase [Alginatibacterium sediminis]
MVGIVAVSHSATLAKGLAELVNQMTQGKCSLAVAGGVDDPQNPIGTDAIAVMDAITEVHDESGVLVLMDLGSALLSAEMALELLPEDISASVQLCSAPFVEGVMAAAVAAAAGLPIATVKSEAYGGLQGKQSHLQDCEPATVVDSETKASDEPFLSFDWTVENPHGLHARPAASIVTALASFKATLELAKGERRVSALSLNSIATLGVVKGDEITFIASGEQAQQAIDAFSSLANQHFGEAQLVANPSAQLDAIDNKVEEAIDMHEIAGALRGLAVSDGIAKGPAVFFSVSMPEVPKREFTDAKTEIQRFHTALNSSVDALQQQASASAVDPEHAQIFNAQALMLSDPELVVNVEKGIRSQLIAEQAWLDAGSQLADSYQRAESEYLRERESDVWDITRRVMNQLCGVEKASLELKQPSILLAKDLSPSDTMGLDPEMVIAICLSEGGKTSHSAILAKAMGIPAIVQANDCMNRVKAGQQVIVDGFKGLLWLEPSVSTENELTLARQQWLEKRELELSSALQTATTLDGRAFEVQANIGGLSDVSLALKNGADGVGLLRTEFLFQACSELPSQQYQYEVYRDIAKALEGRSLTIRSLDVGGDKPLASYPMASEENPFLGHRGIRMCLADPELFKTQLRAVLRACAEYSNIQLMIPMIAQVSELLAVKQLIAECRLELKLNEQQAPLKLGIMIEVPAAVLNADELAEHADFFSIGTNDLTQYVMAADRGNPSVSQLVDYQQPAVLKAIELTCKAANQAGIPVSMCGEMAGDSEMVERLLAMGLDKFSASAALIPAVKAKIRTQNLVSVN